MIVKKVETRLGQMLVEEGLLSEEELEQALADRQNRGLGGKPIGKYLVESGFVKETDFLRILARQFNLALMDLSEIQVQPEVLEKVPEELCRKYKILPLFAIGEEVTVAISDPTQIDGVDMVARYLKAPVQPVLASETQVLQTIAASFGKKDGSEEGERDDISSLNRLESGGERDVDLETLRRAGEEAPIIKMVDKILKLAVREGASDIHVEPGEEQLMVRFRVDGMLQKRFGFSMRLAAAVVSRMKILSDLDISERQKPQDGRIQLKMGDKELEFRVSVLPVYYGEKVVMRILDRASVRVQLENLGLSKQNLRIFDGLVRQPNGIVLVTGPTGSGKSTTLYAALNAINSIDKNIVTVEDPVEYQIPLINQVPVNPRRGLTFAGALRSILRQDPDIVMIGEIRDPETGSIAAEAALTGHLVLSTLHTNDAPSSVTRLIEMGVAPFLLAPTILGILAQRLVRRVCPQCKAPYEPKPAELHEAGIGELVGKVTLHRGKGCGYCGGTGYKGRTGIHEVLKVDEEIRDLITERASASQIRRAAAAKGFKDLRFDGLKKAVSGQTSLEEVIRVTKAVE
ncbi:MAG: type II/IV secretion system protein [Deltaproteobacteria bacterium]|nr:type II/IV secretion system protein [Deltaproteobacteria bacterium]